MSSCCVLVTHSLFSYLYITGTCARYNIISDILIYIIAIYVINKVKEIYDCKTMTYQILRFTIKPGRY